MIFGNEISNLFRINEQFDSTVIDLHEKGLLVEIFVWNDLFSLQDQSLSLFIPNNLEKL